MEIIQTATISFAGTVTAGTGLTLVSPRIASPFRVEKVLASFALNTNRTVQIKPFVAIDDAAPTTTEPSGINILEEFGQVNYVVGDDEQKEILQQFTNVTGGGYVKIYANNTDTFDHTVDVVVTISLLVRE